MDASRACSLWRYYLWYSSYTRRDNSQSNMQNLNSVWVYQTFLSLFLHQMNYGLHPPTHLHLPLHLHQCSMKLISVNSLDSLIHSLSMMMRRNVVVYLFFNHLMSKSVVSSLIQQSTKATKSPICLHHPLQQATWCHRHPTQVHLPHHHLTVLLQYCNMACYPQAVPDDVNQVVSCYQKKKSGQIILHLSKRDAVP